LKYIFLAVPNFCGSTLIHSVLSTSPEVAIFPKKNYRNGRPVNNDLIEGDGYARCGYKKKFLPHSIEANMEHVITDPDSYNWSYIKRKWDRQWAYRYPERSIRIQKTPLDVFRVKLMQPHFENLKWVLSVKNPISHVVSIIVRSTFGMNPFEQLPYICFHVGRALEVQQENIRFLGEKVYCTTHEKLSENQSGFVKDLLEFEPDLKHIDASIVSVKGTKGPIINISSLYEAKKIYRIHPEMINNIMKLLEPYRQVAASFGYDLDKSYEEIRCA
jgi:hypothetical protein